MKSYFDRFNRFISKTIKNQKSDNYNEQNKTENIKTKDAMLLNSDSSVFPINQTVSTSNSIGGTVCKLKRSATPKTLNNNKDFLNFNAQESSEEESSAARLSRRSSVLVKKNN